MKEHPLVDGAYWPYENDSEDRERIRILGSGYSANILPLLDSAAQWNKRYSFNVNFKKSEVLPLLLVEELATFLTVQDGASVPLSDRKFRVRPMVQMYNQFTGMNDSLRITGFGIYYFDGYTLKDVDRIKSKALEWVNNKIKQLNDNKAQVSDDDEEAISEEDMTIGELIKSKMPKMGDNTAISKQLVETGFIKSKSDTPYVARLSFIQCALSSMKSDAIRPNRRQAEILSRILGIKEGLLWNKAYQAILLESGEDKFKNGFGRLLYEKRVFQDWFLRILGSKVGLAAATLHYYETGINVPVEKDFWKLVRVFDIKDEKEFKEFARAYDRARPPSHRRDFAYYLKAFREIQTSSFNNFGSENEGGIDFKSDRMNIIETRSDSKGIIASDLGPALITHLRNVAGFTPQILSIKENQNVRVFLGL